MPPATTIAPARPSISPPTVRTNPPAAGSPARRWCYGAPAAFPPKLPNSLAIWQSWCDTVEGRAIELRSFPGGGEPVRDSGGPDSLLLGPRMSAARIDRQAAFSGTAEVRTPHRFNAAALAAYLADHIDGFAGPLTVSQFRGGQSNPTYKLVTPSASYVLRRKPPGRLLPSAHAVEREYRATAALHPLGFPVARPHLLCEDTGVIGTAFYVMDFVPGRVFWEPHVPGVTARERAAIYDSLNATLARLHKSMSRCRLERFRPSRRLCAAADQTLGRTISSFRDRQDRGNGPAERFPADSGAGQRRGRAGPWRLPSRQLHHCPSTVRKFAPCSTGSSRRSAIPSPISPIT